VGLRLAGVVRVEGDGPGTQVEDAHGNGLHHLVAALVLPPDAEVAAGDVAQHVAHILLAHRRLVAPEGLHPRDARVDHQVVGLVLPDAVEPADWYVCVFPVLSVIPWVTHWLTW